MKMERSWFTGLLLVMSVLSLIPGGLSDNPIDCVTDYNSSTDYFPDKVQPINSQFWDVQYFNHYKILANKIANESYVLYQCGTEPPIITTDSFGKHPAVVVPIPLADGVALTSTVQIPFMELLGLRTDIKSYIGDPQYISESCVLKLVGENELSVHENTTSPVILNWTETNPYRMVLGGTYEGLTDIPIVQDQTLLISEEKEASSKAIFEWLKFYSTLFNKEALANQIVKETAARYDCVSSNANTAAQADSSIPTAVWAYYSTYPGHEGWDLASCDPVFNYYCEYAKDCHVNLLSSNDLMSHNNFSSFAKDADVFFYMSTDWDEVYANNSEWLKEFKSVQNKEVYDYQMSGPNAWFEQRLAEYDVVLEDFCTVVNQTTNIFQHQRKWFRNILRGENIGSSLTGCTNISAWLVTSATACFREEAAPILFDTTDEPKTTITTTLGPTPSAPIIEPTFGSTNPSGRSLLSIISAILLAIFGLLTVVAFFMISQNDNLAFSSNGSGLR